MAAEETLNMGQIGASGDRWGYGASAELTGSEDIMLLDLLSQVKAGKE